MNNILIKILLLPFSLIYGLLTAIRNRMYDSGLLSSHEFPFPVISVGNITVGGTGKTPHVEYLIDLLAGEFKVAVLSRGYGRSGSSFRIVEQDSAISDVGDEPLQVKKKFPGIVVAVDNRRKRGIDLIREMYPETEVVMLDDAYQHRSVTPGYNILLTSYQKLFTRDMLMPSGRLRESAGNSKRADIILVTKAPTMITPIERRMIVKEIGPKTHQYLFFTCLEHGEPETVFPGNRFLSTYDEISTEGYTALLVTGIASPALIEDHLVSKKINFQLLKYPDHHLFNDSEVASIVERYYSLPEGKRCIFTTEKDIVRLSEVNLFGKLKNEPVYTIPVKVRILNDDADDFNNYITGYVRKNK